MNWLFFTYQGPNYYNSEKRSVPIFHEVVRPAAIVEGGPGYVTRLKDTHESSYLLFIYMYMCTVHLQYCVIAYP